MTLIEKLGEGLRGIHSGLTMDVVRAVVNYLDLCDPPE